LPCAMRDSIGRPLGLGRWKLATIRCLSSGGSL
jgi:hypothetical protein